MPKARTQLNLGLNERGPVSFESKEENFLHLTCKLAQAVQRSCGERGEHLGSEKLEYFLCMVEQQHGSGMLQTYIIYNRIGLGHQSRNRGCMNNLAMSA